MLIKSCNEVSILKDDSFFTYALLGKDYQPLIVLMTRLNSTVCKLSKELLITHKGKKVLKTLTKGLTLVQGRFLKSKPAKQVLP